MPQSQLHAIIFGKVQNVYFRAWTRDTALGLNLKGWVRNLPDGTVETVALGTEQALKRFHALLLQGSPASRVDRIEKRPPIPAQDVCGKGFEIRY